MTASLSIFVQSIGASKRRSGVTIVLAAVAIVIITGAEVTLEVSESCPGLKMQVAGTGRPEQANVTVCGTPLTLTEIGAEVCPDTTDSLLGDGAPRVRLCDAYRCAPAVDAYSESPAGMPETP